MSRRIRILLVIAAFIAFVAFGDAFLARVMDRLVMSTGFRYAELYKGKLSGDIAIIGNSRGLHMFHRPAIQAVTNQEVANTSFNALPTVLMPSIWGDYLEHHAKPKKLLFEVSCIGREDEVGSIARFTTFMPHSESLCQAIAKHSRQEYLAAQVSRLYGFNNELTWRSLLLRGKSDQDWIMTETTTDEKIARTIGFGAEAFIRSTDNVDAAKQVIELAIENGIEVTLIVAPYHPEYRKALVELPEWMAWLEQQLGQKIYDYSDCVTERSGFADHMHLNPQGAMLLAERLHRDGVF